MLVSYIAGIMRMIKIPERKAIKTEKKNTDSRTLKDTSVQKLRRWRELIWLKGTDKK